MRILIATGVYPPEIGGPATYTKKLENALPALGFEVSVLPFSKVKKLPKFIRHVAYFFLIIRESRNVDLVYAQDPISVGVPVTLASFLTRKKFVLKVVGDYAWEQSRQRFGYTDTLESFQHATLTLFPKALRWIERWVAKRALRVVVPSKYLGKIVVMWGIPNKKVSVIYNGIESLGDVGNKPVLRGLIKFHGKLIVSIGRLVPWKGFDTLIALLPELQKTFPGVKLLIIGSGPDSEALERLAEEKGVAEDVIFTGALERDILIRYLRASDVFILNTSYEGFSHLILEALAVGVPTITTKVGGNVEIIEHAKNGYLVQPNDTKGILQHTRALLSDATLRASIVASAKRRVKQFSNERMIEEVAKLLKSEKVALKTRNRK
ncbi:glycosyltransferase family 1 protein [Patescibacteria group bacterium]|nr:MAG: glycosyltransferase family 1 protein [Patescibacteria group bacterium]